MKQRGGKRTRKKRTGYQWVVGQIQLFLNNRQKNFYCSASQLSKYKHHTSKFSSKVTRPESGLPLKC